VTTLNELRDQIYEIDQQLVKLLQIRMELAIRIGKEKNLQNLPIVNQNQEKMVLKKVFLNGHDPLEPDQLKEIFITIIRISREIQLNHFNKIQNRK